MSSPSTSSFQLLYQILSNRQKDKIDMILEPLQAMIQLALLSICPIGTKLRIQENILYLQTPTITTMAKEGFDNLFKTYSSSDSNTVIHVIQMYKNLLEYNNDKILVDEYIVDVEKNKVNIDEVFEHIISIYDPHILQIIQHTLLMMQEENDPSNQGHHLDGLNQMFMKYNKAIKEWIKVNLIL